MASNLWVPIVLNCSTNLRGILYSDLFKRPGTTAYTHTASMFGNLTTDIHFWGNPAIQNLAFLRRPSQHMSTSPSGFPKLWIHGKCINLYITRLTSSSASLGKTSEIFWTELWCAWETQFIAPTSSLFDRDYEYPNRSESLPSNHWIFFRCSQGHIPMNMMLSRTPEEPPIVLPGTISQPRWCLWSFEPKEQGLTLEVLVKIG